VRGAGRVAVEVAPLGAFVTLEKNFAEIENLLNGVHLMFAVGSYVQIMNHAEPSCNMQYGTITEMQIAYDGTTYYYTVRLDDSDQLCTCIDDELMEG